MSPQAALVLVAWIPFSLYLFLRFPPQKAAIIGFIGAWLFLPQAEFFLSPLPNYTRMAAACYGILLGALIFDAERLFSFRISWIDLPMIVYCFCPIISQINNNLSPISPTFNQLITWGAPYFVGRIYFSTLDGLKELAKGIFIGGLIYIPFCLIESVMGPLIHEKVYGFPAFVDWSQARRYGGWRPVVFMNHGLMVGVWMMTTALCGVWFWRAGVIPKEPSKPILKWGKWVVTASVWWLWLWKIEVGKTLQGRAINPLVILLFLTFVNCRSTGAWILAVTGLLILFIGSGLRSNLPMLLLAGFTALYLFSGAMGTTQTEPILNFFESLGLSADRVSSLAFRFHNEEILGERIRLKFLFGWGDASEYRVPGAITDSLWIIIFGINGVVGLWSWAAAFLVPVFGFCFRYPARYWTNPNVSPALVLVLCLNLYCIDCLLNAMVNPVFVLICGGVSGLVVKPTANDARPSPLEIAVRARLKRREVRERD
ncbi:O-antigen ligase domain-containing protein [Lusitaniella coriacea]|uniref:O-antigen ligase domain-containing protein n=1 Tax=Lusitaniella coriacea TaxID=1983105 RepID=UPI003CF5C230